MTDQAFGKRLAALRASMGWTQGEAAQNIGVSYRAYQRYESGGMPSRKNLKSLAWVFKCSEAWLLTGEGERLNIYEDKDPDYESYLKVIPSVPAFEKSGNEEHEFKMSAMLAKTAEVLESDTIYRTALASNINAFHQSISAQAEIGEIKKSVKTMQSQVSELSTELKKLKTENAALKHRLETVSVPDKEDKNAQARAEANGE